MPLSLRMQERFRRRSTTRRVAAILYVLSGLIYLAWRLTTFNQNALTLSSVFYFADIIAFTLGLSIIYVSWSYSHRKPPPTPAGLSSDVFIPVYKEPLDIIRQTLIAAKGIDYPHETWVLDDGHRQEIRSLAKELDCHYLSRDDNRFAKAGNLNYGLKHSKGDFVAVFDADFVAMPHALDLLLGFFSQENVSMVQSAPDFYNANNSFTFSNNKKTGDVCHEQCYYFHISQPFKDTRNAAACVGTCVVYRRSALDDIGGIPTETVTEDTHTSLLLHKKGYETVFINETVGYGIEAVDLNDYYKTRLRWSHGNLHVLKHENIFFTKELSWSQRLSYLILGVHYLEGWQQVILFLVPAIALFLGIPPFEISILNVLIILFFPIFAHILLQEMGCGFNRFWTNELYSIARFPVYLLAWRVLFNIKLGWRSSSKSLKGTVPLALISPQLAVLFISLSAIVFGIVKLSLDFQTGPIADAIYAFLTGGEIPDINAVLVQGYSFELVLVVGLFAMFNCFRASLMIKKAFRDAKRSEEDYSFDLQLPAEINIPGRLEPVKATTKQISISKIRFGIANQALRDLPQQVSANLYLPSGPINLTLCLVPESEKKGFWDETVDIQIGSGQEQDDGNESILEVDILWDGQASKDRLMQCLLSIDWQREIQHGKAYFLTPLEFLEKIVLFKNPFKTVDQRWQPAILGAKGNGSPLPIFFSKKNDHKNEQEAQIEQHIMTFRDLDIGEAIEINNFNDAKSTFYYIIETIPLDIFGQKGLDGATIRKYKCRPLNKTL